eukprot:CAMPEP_0185914672 /NCGR_PEP_ID=MMETSP0924C-20121207/1537_1 /TAXON_ID=321610 /ORGANISM="Perkinsus chesapeaki, Strain ATCC PRA-65" /LENGTH=45 /DNA_ID= /DNA_START= /DNA_END= /DNA_ORIENTATION=
MTINCTDVDERMFSGRGLADVKIDNLRVDKLTNDATSAEVYREQL